MPNVTLSRLLQGGLIPGQEGMAMVQPAEYLATACTTYDVIFKALALEFPLGYR